MRLFGSPSQDDPFSLSYGLALWPEHRYTWHVDDGGLVTHGGFVLRHESDMPKWLAKEIDVIRQTFHPYYHTSADVRRVFGDPDLDLSWFPQIGWYYGPLPGEYDLFFDFDLGLLTSVSLEASQVLQSRLRGHDAGDDHG